MNNNIKIPGIEDVVVADIKVLEGGTAICYVEMPVRTYKCPCCDAKTRKIHNYRIQKIKHLKWFERLPIFSAGNADTDAKHAVRDFMKATQLLNDISELHKNGPGGPFAQHKGKSFKELAQPFGVLASTVMRRFDEMERTRGKRIFPFWPLNLCGGNAFPPQRLRTAKRMRGILYPDI